MIGSVNAGYLFLSVYNRRMMRLPKRIFREALPAIVLAVLAYASSAQAPPDRWKQVVQPYVDAQMFMGSVLVAEDGKIIFSKSYGMADLEWSIPNSSTTRFNIASMTKQFTAASILLLEDRGKLRTDDLVKKYLPEAPASWDKITIYHLLTHTSGIREDAAKYEPGTPDKLVFNDRPLNHQPGEQWSYTNLGYIVLGYLLERISGQTYEAFVQENIFKPLGMKDSGMMSVVTVISPLSQLPEGLQWICVCFFLLGVTLFHLRRAAELFNLAP